MMYRLQHITDSSKGDSGGMSMFLYKTSDGEVEREHDARPRVGGVIRVGSIYARSFTAQDWWQTSLITKILINEPTYMKFETLHSTYEWWSE